MEIEYYQKYVYEKIENRNRLIPRLLGIDKDSSMIYRYSFSLYSEVGTLQLNIDPTATVFAKQQFFKGLRGVEFDYWLNMGQYPELKEKKKSYEFSSKIVMDLPNILLSEHEEGIQYLFNEAFDFHKDDKIKETWQKRTISFLYLMKGEKQKAKEIMQNAYVRADDYSRGYSNVVAGILNDDIKLVNKGIAAQINYGGGYNGPEANYHHNATGLAKLALRFGMEPDLSDIRINKKLLEYEKVDYEDIDNMFEALGVEPVLRHELRNY